MDNDVRTIIDRLNAEAEKLLAKLNLSAEAWKVARDAIERAEEAARRGDVQRSQR